MHADRRDELLVVRYGLVVRVHVRLMLEVVGVEVAAGQRHVGRGVLGIDDDFQLDALFGEIGCDLFQNFGMRRGRRADDELLRHRHGRNGKHECENDEDSYEFLHGERSFLLRMRWNLALAVRSQAGNTI